MTSTHPNNMTSPSVAQRRGILRILFGSFAGLGFAILGATGSLWALAVGRFLLPNVVAEPPSHFFAGNIHQYPAGYVETRYREQYGVWIVHGFYQGQSQIFALRAACTHLGCITIWQSQERRFQCPCHGSSFAIDGANIEGPAPRTLERVAIRLADDGQIEIDRSRVYRQELGQWDDPDSYLAV
jgi:cytochrome b6-f complex iron-sulfur subunit